MRGIRNMFGFSSGFGLLLMFELWLKFWFGFDGTLRVLLSPIFFSLTLNVLLSGSLSERWGGIKIPNG